MADRQDAKYYLERKLRDLGLTDGDSPQAQAVRTQAQLFIGETHAADSWTASQYYAVAGLVERCVFRALNAPAVSATHRQAEAEAGIRALLAEYE